MQNTSSTFGSHHPISSTGRSVAGVVAVVCAALAGALLGLVIADFVSEVYIGSEAELGRWLIGFLSVFVVFFGMLGVALIRSGRSGSGLHRVFLTGVAIATVGAFALFAVPFVPGPVLYAVPLVGVATMAVGVFLPANSQSL